MSASEKLKPLVTDATWTPEDGYSDLVIDGERAGHAQELLLAALPQIVAVVEAAQDEASFHQYRADLASCPKPICRALAALEEALS